VFGVIGSSSAANTTALTPGAVGVTQAANAAALDGYTSASTAVDYSVTQQFLVTAVNCCYALVLVVIVFGWRGGRELVSEAYAEARTRKTETGPSPAASGSGEADRS
jgi:hypothetical protein